jgi:hypothetical protein
MTKPFQVSPQAVETAFYEAFVQLDLALMSAVWLDGGNSVCIHPGGPLLQGKDSVLRSWAEIFSGAVPPSVEHRLVHHFASDGLVVHLVEERIRSRNAPAGQVNLVIATNVYVKTDSAWYLAEHHASLPLVEKQTAQEKKRSLH